MVIIVFLLVMLSRGYLLDVKNWIHDKVREDWPTS
jgi:hypothetical protein